MAEEYGIFIGGEWVDSTGEGQIEVTNPANGEVLAHFPQGSREDVQRAVEAAEKAFPKWKATPPAKRGEIVFQAAQVLRERKDDLGKLLTRETGKIIAEGRGEVQEAIDFFEYIAGEGRRLLGETVATELPDKFAMTVRLPVGVAGLITTWNFPIAVPSWKIGAALMSGCSLVFKPSSGTPLMGAELAKALDEAGVPPGVLNLVTGSGEVVGDEIVMDPHIRAISFTGGVDAGREVYTKAASRLANVGLELGGKNPIILMADADQDLALEGVLFATFGTAGQRCTACSRLILHRKIYDEFLEELVEETENLKVGDPLDPGVYMGPVKGAAQEAKVLRYVEIGKEEGAKLRTGGKKLTGGGYDLGHYIAPTIFEGKPEMRIAREEIFGPLLTVLQARSYSEAVRIANDTIYGLSSSIYTQDVNLAFRAMYDIEAGITYVNAPTIGAEVQLPFGGVKNTGSGHREAGTSAIEEFTEIKTVYVDYSGQLQKA
ncbi:MAG: aldehyde dehydrogenase family protein, partial [Thermoplasmata archaeon]